MTLRGVITAVLLGMLAVLPVQGQVAAYSPSDGAAATELPTVTKFEVDEYALLRDRMGRDYFRYQVAPNPAYPDDWRIEGSCTGPKGYSGCGVLHYSSSELIGGYAITFPPVGTLFYSLNTDTAPYGDYVYTFTVTTYGPGKVPQVTTHQVPFTVRQGTSMTALSAPQTTWKKTTVQVTVTMDAPGGGVLTAPGRKVFIQARRAGKWRPIPGSAGTTDKDGLAQITFATPARRGKSVKIRAVTEKYQDWAGSKSRGAKISRQ